jgi:hypothetical protein
VTAHTAFPTLYDAARGHSEACTESQLFLVMVKWLTVATDARALATDTPCKIGLERTITSHMAGIRWRWPASSGGRPIGHYARQ